MQTKLLGCDRSAITRAGAILSAGGLVVIPTETVYGLAARADSERAVRAIYAAKGRPPDNPLIVHYATVDAVETEFGAALSPGGAALLRAFAPGPLTLVLPAPGWVPAVVRAGLPTVAVRVPDHPVARAVITAAGVPLAAPSANRSGRPSPTDAVMAREEIGGRVAAILDAGAAPIGIESTVVDVCDPRRITVLRAGAIDAAQLRAVAGCEVVESSRAPDSAITEVSAATEVNAADADAPSAPGMRHAHYRPAVPVYRFAPQQRSRVMAWAQNRSAGVGPVVALVLAPWAYTPRGARLGIELCVFGDESAYAHGLYRALVDAERLPAQLVVAELPTAHAGLIDRITRAARALWSETIVAANRCDR